MKRVMGMISFRFFLFKIELKRHTVANRKKITQARLKNELYFLEDTTKSQVYFSTNSLVRVTKRLIFSQRSFQHQNGVSWQWIFYSHEVCSSNTKNGLWTLLVCLCCSTFVKVFLGRTYCNNGFSSSCSTLPILKVVYSFHSVFNDLLSCINTMEYSVVSNERHLFWFKCLWFHFTRNTLTKYNINRVLWLMPLFLRSWYCTACIQM